MGVNTISVTEFARRLKEKYPKYAAAADDKLVVAFCQKFSQYKVNYEGGKPISVSVVARTAEPAAPSPTNSSEAAPVATSVAVPPASPHDSSEPSPVSSIQSNVASNTPEKVPTDTAVVPSPAQPVTPAPVEAEQPAMKAPSAAVPPVQSAHLPGSADETAAALQTASHPSVEMKPSPADSQEPNGKTGSRMGVIVIGLLFIAALVGVAAYQRGLIPRKSSPSALPSPPAVEESKSSAATDGDPGEYVSGRTTYSDPFVNVESIRIRRSGQGSILTATVYNKGEVRLNTVTIRVSCFSGDGNQVVTASFMIYDIAPGTRVTRDMTGTLSGVPSRVDIVHVNRM